MLRASLARSAARHRNICSDAYRIPCVSSTTSSSSAASLRHQRADGYATRRRVLKDPIVVTERAAARIRTILSNDPHALGVRLGVCTRGCNGLSYTLDYAKERVKFEDEVTTHGVTVFIDPKALMHVIGTTMDFEEDEMRAEFVFNNPNAIGECGCGESFNVSSG